MNEITLDQNDDELLTYKVSDEAPEVAACCGKWRRVVHDARRYASGVHSFCQKQIRLHVAFMSRGVAGSEWESLESKGNRRDMPRHDERRDFWLSL